MNPFDIEIISSINYAQLPDAPRPLPPAQINDAEPSNRAKIESIFLNICYGLISFFKIILTNYSLFASNENCTGPIHIWLYTMLVYDAINFTSVFFTIILTIKETQRESFERRNSNSLDYSFQNYDLTFHSEIRRRIGNERDANGFDVTNNIERKFKIISYVNEISRFYYLLGFLFGNVMYFSDEKCPFDKTPFFSITVIIFLIFGYVYFAVPILIFTLICLYLPLGLILIYCFPDDEKKKINLKKQKYKKEQYGDRDCCICMFEFVEKEEIAISPCNENHFFHEMCITSWLNVNDTCPICRKNLLEVPSIENQ